MNPVVKLTDEEKQQQAAIDVEAVRAKMASKGLIEGAPHGTTILDTAAAETRSEGQQPAKKRATRSDKGQPKKEAPQSGGLLTEAQRRDLCILLDDIQIADRNYWAADETRKRAGVKYNAYLDSITQK